MWSNRDDYSKQDERGRWINTEFPPDSFTKYPSYSGYRTINREYLFYQYSLMLYEVMVTYNGKNYILVTSEDGCYVLNEDGEEISPVYPTGNDLIKEFRFSNGLSLLDIVDYKDVNIDIC